MNDTKANPLNVLLSAYACEPNKGSEPGVGWNWAIELAKRGHRVHVITRRNNEAAITQALKLQQQSLTITFHYFDLPMWLRWWKRGGRGIYLYSVLWQIGILYLALRLKKEYSFDLVHHITFGSIRMPTFMGLLGPKFIFGPIGGGETTPHELRRHFPIKGKITDLIRDISNLFVSIDPFVRMSFATADCILVKTPDNLKYIPSRHHHKCRVALEIGIGGNAHPSNCSTARVGIPRVRVLFVGRHLYWKGMGLGIRAFSKALQSNPNISLTMIGDGPQRKEWVELSHKLGVSNDINWLGWISKENVIRLYSEHDIFLFPSLHDSSGNVVLEAASAGLPTVCLDLGGPGAIINSHCGIKVNANTSEREVIDSLSNAISLLASDTDYRARMSESAQKWALEQTWTSRVFDVYSTFEK